MCLVASCCFPLMVNGSVWQGSMYRSESEFFKIIFINFRMKCLKKADVLQPDGDYQVEKVLVRHLFLKLIHLSKQKC